MLERKARRGGGTVARARARPPHLSYSPGTRLGLPDGMRGAALSFQLDNCIGRWFNADIKSRSAPTDGEGAWKRADAAARQGSWGLT